MLRRNAVDQTLPPPCGRTGKCVELRGLEVLEASDDQARLYDALSVDLLLFEDPTRIDNIRCMLLGHALEGAQVQPAGELVEHSLAALLFMCFGF